MLIFFCDLKFKQIFIVNRYIMLYIYITNYILFKAVIVYDYSR